MCEYIHVHFPKPFFSKLPVLNDQNLCMLLYLLMYLYFSEEETSCEFGSTKYFALCGLGGILSCGITHTAIVPLDLVKCRIQVDPAKYGGIIKGFKVTIKEDGMRGLGKGWAPTAIGYSLQGLCKFGFYEVFKNLYSNILGEVSFILCS